MHAQPAIVTAVVAVVATAGILFTLFGPGNGSQHSGNARMITAAAVSKAGAIEIRSVPPAGAVKEKSPAIGPGFNETAI
jgi:hypothetical protein